MTITSNQPMSREELLDLAALDAFGLLDEYDAALYTRSFHHAPATVQDEIRQLQAQLVTDPSLIAVADEPPAELRARVLASVAAAREREEAQLAPLATIGRPRAAETGYAPQRMRLFTSGLFWRAATFVLASAVIAMAYSWYSAVQTNVRLAELALSKGVEDQLREMMGEDFTAFIKTGNSNKAIRAVPLRSTDAAHATLYINESDNVAFLLVTGLPASSTNQPYELVVNIAGTDQPVKQFASNGLVAGVRVDNLSRDMIASTSWKVRSAAGEVVLSA
jgi:hypothetical protein